MLNIDDSITEYWKLVSNADLESLENILKEKKLANRRIYGEPSQIGYYYSQKQRKNERASDSFCYSCTALHFASRNGMSKLATLLIQNGSDVNDFCYESNKGLTTSLVLATWEGDLETMKVLLENGANPNLCASSESPLYTACEHHLWEKRDLLLAYGARHDIFTAAISGDIQLVTEQLRAYPPLFHAKSHKRNRTPLEESIYHNQEETTKAIIEEMEKANW